MFKIEINKIYNEDCMSGLKRIESNSIDLIVTDPPYKTTSRGSAGNSGGMLQKEINKKGQVFKHNDISPAEYIPDLYRVLKDGGHFYIMSNHVNLVNMLNTCIDAGFKFVKSLVWNKGNKIMGQFYMSQFEYILFFRKGRGLKINNCGTADILNVPNIKTKDSDGNNLHDTEKPVGLMKILIENSSQPDEVVLDPFMGIGSTAIACIETNRKFVGFEIDNKYYYVCYSRLGEVI